MSCINLRSYALALALFSFWTLAFPSNALAACASPSGVEGEVLYNGTYKTVQFCDGTNWISMSGTAAAETDPQVGTLTNGKWCTTDGTSVNCTSDAPAAGAAGSTGQIQFNGGSGAFAADSNLVWDNTNKRLGIGTATPGVNLDIAGTTDAVYMRVRGPTHTVQLGEIGSGGELKTVTNGSFILGTNNTTRMTIDANGNVGIGTTSPGSTLDVKGTIRLSGATSGYVALTAAAAAGSTTYTLPSADGSNGQVLSTNGSGVLSWTTPAASSGNYFWAAASHLTYSVANGSCPTGSRAIQVHQSSFGQTGTQICAADTASDGARTICDSVRYWYITVQGTSGAYTPSNRNCSASVPHAWPWARQSTAPNSRPDEWHSQVYVVCCRQ